MLASERLLEIEEKFADDVQRIVPVEMDGETLRIILYLKDGTNLRVTEQWEGKILKRYSYYWLTHSNELQIGWDNAPHYTHLETFRSFAQFMWLTPRRFEAKLRKCVLTETNPLQSFQIDQKEILCLSTPTFAPNFEHQ